MRLILMSFIYSFYAWAAAVPFEMNYLTNDQKNQLKGLLQQALDTQKLPSIVAAATYGDKVIWAQGVGFSNIADQIAPNVQEDLYRWASVSKVATERFAQAMEEDGIVNQGLPIENYINIKEPSFLRRCFSDNKEFQNYITCTKNYGGFAAIEMMQGFPLCFNPTSFGETELSFNNKTYKASVVDKNVNGGEIVYKDANNSVKCRANFDTKLAFVSSNRVTLNNLLNHTSGIIHYSELGFSTEPPESEMSNVQKIIARKNAGVSQMEWAIPYFYPKAPLLFLPGKGKNYSTFGYNLAGVVLEKASGKTFDKILNGYSWQIGALSMQPDYLGIKPTGPYRRSLVYKREGGKFIPNEYTTDNSYKLAGGGIMSTIVDLARFCVAIGQDDVITKNGSNSYTHLGSHSTRSNSILSLLLGGGGEKQCLVLMTNTQHSAVDLSQIKSTLEKKLYDLKIWQPKRAN